MRSLRSIVATSALIAAVGSTTTAHATTVYPPSVRACSAAIEAESAKFVDVVHDEIRASIAANLEAKTHACSGPMVCAGGPTNGAACTDNSTCGAAGGVDFECQPQANAGIVGVFNQAKASLRGAIAAACSPSDLLALHGGGGSVRCDAPGFPPGGLTASSLADCIVTSTAGSPGRSLVGTVGDVLAQGAPNAAVDDPAPIGFCSVLLGRRIDYGSASTNGFLTTVGVIEPLLADGCVAGNPVCDTKSAAIVGNQVAPPVSIMSGPISLCLVSRSLDAGNGTPQSGSINLVTGQQVSRSGIATSVHFGALCPVCSATTQTCGPTGAGGAHEGQPCTRLGETDIACPPLPTAIVPIFGGIVEETTEAVAVAVPLHNPAAGTTNPAQVFCGKCDLDSTMGCRSDQECAAAFNCSAGVGSGCCQFGANSGAFGDPQRSSIVATGVRGPFIAALAGIACHGTSDTQVIDASLGLPGPVRSLEVRLNVMQYDTAFPSSIPTLVPTSTQAAVATATPTPSRTLTRTQTRTRTPKSTRTPTKQLPPPFDRCRSIEECQSKCVASEAFCDCSCFNQFCRCSGACIPRACPPP